jgi:glycosyltransferase involved in cell wall biosynthesis
MKIVGIMAVYNDDDVIEEVLENLVAEDIEVIVVDGGSTDNTFEICKKFEGQGLIKLFQVDTVFYDVGLVLRILYDFALREAPDWILRCDADEFLSSYENELTLRDAIIQADSEGYNLIQFDRFDFFMTDKDEISAKSIKDKMPYYSYGGDFIYRAWKFYPGINIIGDYAGHFPIFPHYINYRIFPKKFVMRHYPLRNEKQATKKMEGVTRGRSSNQKEGVRGDRHFKTVLENNFTKTFDHKILTKYNENKLWNYKITLYPYTDIYPPKKEDVFADDGKLLKRQKGLLEYKILLDHYKSQQIHRRVYRKLKKFKNKIF